ncbi:Phytanoyl-CoA dioxygenase [Acidothermus cellulolyticus 11B]|uniref:Phytanoyl-CoA dioxygenase n=2 Tax=Acidothermus cellulolyticus TaxID=28049 RepID=A0LVX5_ACIC1|nr:Phytanoyl-CoA dioxygenase [Acidothermus cellulolyticus 11B]
MEVVVMQTYRFTSEDCRLADFRSLVERETDQREYPLAERIEKNVVIYGERFRTALASEDGRDQAERELARVFADGPGVAVFEAAFPDTAVVDRATAAFRVLIEEQHAAGRQAGDHFAKPGANDRVWHALDKLAFRAPEVFVDYYANDVIAAAARAWLGPNYQVTSQVNVVNPGGKAQVAHRDYHLGFMSDEQASRYPAHLHWLSAGLTLQGAVAHTDMPVESGPTMYLPYSQLYGPGYLAFHRPEFIEYFNEHYVQLPLRKGDAAFFNPAVFHGAGENRSAEIKRMANLLQISAAFGRAMEVVNRIGICRAVYPALLDRARSGMSERELHNVVAAAAEGYAFPTNLDNDPPVNGLAPATQADLVWRALCDRWDPATLAKELDQWEARRHPAKP